ncbi:hypothetical protein E4T42_00044 [Aureobasidium subglaciale]|nr:hypothetical protein E4T42_00044 [Aureobasidium subglaciale]
MLSGQTQRRYGIHERKLEPEDIKDIKNMLDRSSAGTKIKNYKVISGLMFFEVRHRRWHKGLHQVADVRRYLVLGQDNNEEGYLAAMYLTDLAHSAITTHGTTLKDTRGGFPEVDFCSLLQLKGLTKRGNPSKSYDAHLRTRKKFCKAVLGQLKDSLTWKSQDWKAVLDEINSCKHLLRDNDDNEKHESEADDPDPAHGRNDDDNPDSDDDSEDKFYSYRRPKSEHELDSDGDLDLDVEDDRPDSDDEGNLPDLDDERNRPDSDDKDDHHPSSREDRFDDSDHPGSSNGGDEDDGELPKFGGSRNLDNDMDIDEILFEVRNNLSPSPSVRSRSQNRSLGYILVDDDIDVDVGLSAAHQSPAGPKIETMSPEPQIITHRTRLGREPIPFDTAQDDSTSYIDLTEDPIIEVFEIED